MYVKYRIEEFRISKLRLALSLIILSITSIAFYSLFYMFRESIRYFSITTDHEIWLLSEVEVRFYNIFYAFVAIVMGTSAAIRFLVDRPLRLNREVTVRSSILNDQRVLNWLFVSWASKLGLIFGIFFCGNQGYFEFSLYPHYAFMIILFMIVLYLQIWTNIIRYVKIEKLKLLLVSSVFFLASSFLLGSLNLINYKKMNENVLSKNVYHNYDLIKPKSNYWKWNSKYFQSQDIFIVHHKNLTSNKPIIIFKNEEVDNLADIDTLIKEWKYGYPEQLRHRLQIRLNVNAKTQMKYVNDLRHQLALSVVSRIGYSVTPIGLEGNIKRYKYCEIPSINYNYNFIPAIDPNPVHHPLLIEIKNGQFVIKDQIVASNNLSSNILEALKNGSFFWFKIAYQESERYDHFIRIYSSIFEAITEQRNQYALSTYGTEFEYLGWNEKKIIRNKYPIVIEDENYKSKFKGRTDTNTG